MVTDFLQHSKIQWKILWMTLNFQDGLQKHVIPAALYKWVVMFPVSNVILVKNS